MSANKFCTTCLYNGVDINECYSHYPGKECPSAEIRIESITCSKCGKKGHLQSKCFAKKCRFCKEFGHIIKNCPELTAKLEAEQGRWCSFCEESGHTVRFCSNPHNLKNINKYCPYCDTSFHSLKECSSRQRR